MGAADDSMNRDVPLPEETPKPPPSGEWKKVTFQKNRRKFKPKDEVTPVPKPIYKPEPLAIDLEDIVIQPKLKTYKSLQERKNGGDSPEPLPIFDCIFCVGIHEHLVT
jgi:hypothetical protein